MAYDQITADLLQENEALKKDAERYRWLRNKYVTTTDFVVLNKVELDFAIDSALAQERGEDYGVDILAAKNFDSLYEKNGKGIANEYRRMAVEAQISASNFERERDRLHKCIKQLYEVARNSGIGDSLRAECEWLIEFGCNRPATHSNDEVVAQALLESTIKERDELADILEGALAEDLLPLHAPEWVSRAQAAIATARTHNEQGQPGRADE